MTHNEGWGLGTNSGIVFRWVRSSYCVTELIYSVLFDVGDFPSVSAPTLAHVDSLLLGIIEYNFIPLPQDLMTRKGGIKEVMRGINGGIKRLIKLLTVKYYYHCFINSPKVHIPHTPPTFGRSSPTCTHCQENGQKRK